ncbi:MAG: DnaD domain protein [Bacteroidales bacterium]|nr:DnaD domain protein [Bacteroidales bacterium]
MIEYKSQQRKKKSGRYRLLSFELREVRPQKTTDANIDEEKMSGKSAVNFTADQGADVGADQGADVGADGSDLYKLNKTKLNKEEDKDAREFAKVISVFQNNIHPPTPIEAEKISHWLEEVDADVVIHAITEAVNYNARSMSYINSILNDYTRKSIKTKADLDAYLRDKQDQKCVVDFKKYKRGEADAQARSGGFRPIPREWLE